MTSLLSLAFWDDWRRRSRDRAIAFACVGPAARLIPHDVETNYLRVYMARLRAKRKLEPDSHESRCFITEPGVGYRFQQT